MIRTPTTLMLLFFQVELPEPLPYVNTVPRWLGPTLMLFGLSALVLWGVAWLLPRVPLISEDMPMTLLLFLLVLGTAFTTAGTLGSTRSVGAAAMALFAAGRFVEGGAAVRTFRKFGYMIRNFSFPGDRKKVVQKIRYIAVRAGVGLVVTGSMYGILLRSGVQSTSLFALTLAWTLGTLILAIIGLSWKLESAEDNLSSALIIGLLLTFAGATVYDYVNLATDVLHIAVGTGAFIAGLLAGIIAVLLK